jgi:hypothetical protein
MSLAEIFCAKHPRRPRVSHKGRRATPCRSRKMASTREEVVLLFGINQAWHAGQKEVTVQLTDRLILSPFAAKRLSMLLTNVVREHEARFGPVPVEAARTDPPAAS